MILPWPRELRSGTLTAMKIKPLLLALGLLATPSLAEARHHSHNGQAHGGEAVQDGQSLQGSQSGAFDYYLLSLSIAPSFCALSPRNQAKAECRTLVDADFRQTPLTVHGLWPNLASVSVNRQPQHCQGPALTTLPGDLQAQLRHYMPGGPRLARHEWERHGTCSGLSPETYFATLVHLAQSANGTIGAVMRDAGMLGHDVRIADLISGVAGRDPALARAIVVSCRFPRGVNGASAGGALIEEVRITLSKDFGPVPVERVGMRQNSGCPQGAGFLPG